MGNIFSRQFEKAKPKSEKCDDCGKLIEPQHMGEYGWLYVCEDCETNWPA